MRIKIGKKIGIAFFIFFVEILAFMFILTMVVDQHEHWVNEIQEEVEEIELMYALRVVLAQVVMPVNGFLISGGTRNELENFKTLNIKIKNLIDKIDKLEFDKAEERELFNHIRGEYFKVKEIASKVFSISDPIGDIDAQRLMEEMDRIADGAIVKAEKFHQFAYEELEEVQADLQSTKNLLRLIISVGILFNIILIIAGLLFFRRTISSPIVYIRDAAAQVGRGNLEQRLDIESGDEIGELAISFNKMVEDLKSSQQKIEMQNEELNAANEELVTTNEELRVATEELKQTNEELNALKKGLENRVKACTVELTDVNEQLNQELAERKKTEGMLKELNNCFLQFGPDPLENMDIITKTTAFILKGACVLYNRLEGNLLCTISGWQIPQDFPKEDKAKGHICYDVVSINKNEPLIIRDLDKSHYAKSDPNVKRYNLKTYIGCVVRIKDKPVGSLCVVYQEDREFKSNEIEALLILAKALGIEEEHKRADKMLKETYEELKGTQRELIQAEKMAALGTLSAGMAHEINNPLMGAMLLVQNLASEQEEGTREHKALSQIEEGLKRITNVISKLLAFSRKEELVLEKAKINDIIKDALPLILYEFKLKGVELIANYAEDLPDVKASTNAMQQVLMNVLLNAKDAVLDSKSKRVTITTYLENNMVKVKIKDEGCGIKKEDMEKVFDPFFTTKPVGKGLGMGMSIVKTIMDQHRGRIDIYSEEGKGTEVILSLPLSKS